MSRTPDAHSLVVGALALATSLAVPAQAEPARSVPTLARSDSAHVPSAESRSLSESEIPEAPGAGPRMVGWLVTAAGVSSTIMGGVALVAAIVEEDAANGRCIGMLCTEADRERHRLRSVGFANVAAAALGVGAVASGIGLTLYVSAPRSDSRPEELSTAARVELRPAGASLTIEF